MNAKGIETRSLSSTSTADQAEHPKGGRQDQTFHRPGCKATPKTLSREVARNVLPGLQGVFGLPSGFGSEER